MSRNEANRIRAKAHEIPVRGLLRRDYCFHEKLSNLTDLLQFFAFQHPVQETSCDFWSEAGAAIDADMSV
jgi:hypothetical protein